MAVQNKLSKDSQIEDAPLRNLVPDKSKNQKLGRAIPAKIFHQVQLRDGGQCTHHEAWTGRRCNSRRYLEVHYIWPYAKRGDHSLENLTLLCSGTTNLGTEYIRRVKFRVILRKKDPEKPVRKSQSQNHRNLCEAYFIKQRAD